MAERTASTKASTCGCATAMSSTSRRGNRPSGATIPMAASFALTLRRASTAEAGLDSHFYSASYEECRATLARFNDAWGIESSEVFQVNLPDSTTGECPAGNVPVYRTWNGRADSNHRYTTSMATRDQMIAKGH